MHLLNRNGLMGLAAALGLCALGCGAEPADVADSSQEETLGTLSREVSYLSVAQIADVLIATNNSEILEGQVAVEKASHATVKAYAAKMLAEHSQANDEVTTLLASLRTVPRSSPLSISITNSGLIEVRLLRQLPATVFDRRYIEGQIAAHERALTIIGNRLIPLAGTPAVRLLLERARALVANHLALGLSVRASLASR